MVPRPAGGLTAAAATANHGEDKLGTVDRAIRERNIFTALVKMPEEVQKVFLENGWIGKNGIDDGSDHRSGGNVLSLHKNAERVKAVAKRYESGLVWTDARALGVNWATLRPDVVVNRFPRDYTNAALRLCGRATAAAGERGHDDHVPRAYAAADVRRFVDDYSLTACVSMLRAFVGGGVVGQAAKHSENGQVPLSALHFAMNLCEQYVIDGGQSTDGLLTGTGPEWDKFFEHYYMIAHDNQKFAASEDDAKLMCELTSLGGRLLDRLSGLRPQTAMDGYGNAWLVKSTKSANGQSCCVMLNRIDRILKRLTGANRAADVVLQKYVETPLVCNGKTFDVQTWIAISTLDGRLTVWSYQTCCVLFRKHEFSPGADGKSRCCRPSAAHATVQTCGLKQLKGKLCSMAALPGKHRHGRLLGGDQAAVCSKVKTALAAVAAAGAEAALNLRPNSFELFRATFVVADDLRPWLVDIRSDPTPAHAFNHAVSAVASAVARNVARVLVAKDRASRSRIGQFEVIHKSDAIPGVSYVPRPFSEKRPASKRKCDRGRDKRAARGGEPDVADLHRWADDRAVSTYIEKIHVNEPQPQPPQNRGRDGHPSSRGVRKKRRWTAATAASWRASSSAAADDCYRPGNGDNGLCLADLKESMARLRTESKCNVFEAEKCLRLLDRWKTRVMSAQRFYKTVMAKNKSAAAPRSRW